MLFALKFKKIIVLVSFLIVSSFLFSGGAFAQSAQKAEEKPQEKSEPNSENKKKEKSPNIAKKQKQSDLEKKLSELDNLYVPIHWSDYATGLAIGGYDPLSYFISEKSEAGDERFQYLWHGVTWQFTSNANLLAFKRTPSVYAPRYAGYDAYAISKGILSQGLPSIWVIKQGKLYLFHNQVNRYLWQENRSALNKKIEENWQELSLEIPRFKVF